MDGSPFVIEKELGRGGFGVVFAVVAADGRRFAAKAGCAGSYGAQPRAGPLAALLRRVGSLLRGSCEAGV